jgi:hypothetical protein
VEGCCECGDDASDSVKCGKFLDYLRNCSTSGRTLFHVLVCSYQLLLVGDKGSSSVRERDHSCSLLLVLYTKYTEGLELGRSGLSILLCAC